MTMLWWCQDPTPGIGIGMFLQNVLTIVWIANWANMDLKNYWTSLAAPKFPVFSVLSFKQGQSTESVTDL